MPETDYSNVKPKGNQKQLPVQTKDEIPNKKQRARKEPLVQSATVRKKGIVERLVGGLLGPNGIRAIGSYVGHEIIVPMIKNAFVDSMTTGINMAVFKDQPQPNKRNNPGWNNRQHQNTNRVQYNQSYQNNQVKQYQSSNATAMIYTIREAVFPNREEALMILDNMMNEIDKYGQVSVADYYDWIGIGDSTFADVSYGWEDLNRARVVSVRGGYAISLPPVGVIES